MFVNLWQRSRRFIYIQEFFSERTSLLLCKTAAWHFTVTSKARECPCAFVDHFTWTRYDKYYKSIYVFAIWNREFIYEVDVVITRITGWRQAIVRTNVRILLIRILGNLSESLCEILTFLFKKMRLKMSSAKCRHFCLGPNVLRMIRQPLMRHIPGSSLVMIVPWRYWPCK